MYKISSLDKLLHKIKKLELENKNMWCELQKLKSENFMLKQKLITSQKEKKWITKLP